MMALLTSPDSMTEHARQIAIYVETTGTEVEIGHRVIEVGSVEIFDGQITGGEFHRYFNPERKIDAAAAAVHGITLEHLKGQPSFAAEIDRWKAWLRDSRLIVLSDFHRKFLDAEYARASHASFDRDRVEVVSELARTLLPNEAHGLTNLCDRFEINLPVHCAGAQLDAYALGEIYLALTKRILH